MARLVIWLLLIGMGAFVAYNAADIIKCLIARKKARNASDQNKNSEKECDHSNHS